MDMEEAARMGAVRSTIDRGQESILEILVELMVPRRRKRKSRIPPVERLLVGRKMLC